MDVCRVLVLFYFSYFSLTSGVTNALTADVVFDVLSRRFDNIIHEIKTVKSDVSEIRHGINKLEKRIENVEHSASAIKTFDDNSIAGISHFGMPDRLKRQSKVLHKMLATEKVILREAVDQLQNTFSDFQSEIRSQMSSMNMYVGESVENLNQTVTNHMSDVNMDVSALKLDLQNKMDVSENKLDEIDKEVNEVKAEVKLDVTNAKAEVTSRLGSEIANVKTNLRSIEKQQEKRTVDIDVQISDLQRRIAKEESTSSQLSRRISTEEGVSACPNGWITFNNNCYSFVSTKQTWFHASKACRDQDARLVDIGSKAEEDFLRQTIKRLHAHDNPQTVGYWTGGNDLAVEGHWAWGYPGEAQLTYTDWFHGEPNNVWYDGREEDCIALWGHDGHDYQWNDQPCDVQDFYICKTEIKFWTC